MRRIFRRAVVAIFSIAEYSTADFDKGGALGIKLSIFVYKKPEFEIRRERRRKQECRAMGWF